MTDRVAYERRRRTIRAFHRLYYDSPWQTWKNTRWLSVNAYKTPLDLWIYQELIVSLRPQLIVETGTADGGSTLFLASVCDAVGSGRIVSIDSAPNADRPAHARITYVTASSVAPDTVALVAEHARDNAPVLVILDSDHRRDHVLAELRAYAQFVTPGSYLIVEDTNLNGHPVVDDFGPGPMEALRAFLTDHEEFTPDGDQERFLLSFNPGGYLKRAPGRRAGAPRRRDSQLLPRIACAVAIVFVTLVGVPELLGDQPYDPRPSAWARLVDAV
jgi:cephalosporin hydroxylase